MTDVLINARLFAGGVNLSGQSNKIEVQLEPDEEDTTVFEPDNPADAGWHTRAGTTLDAKLAGSGFWNAGDPGKVDDSMWAGLGLVDVWTAVKGTGAVGDVCYSLKALRSKYTLGADYGKLFGFDVAASGAGNVFRGVVAHPYVVARAANGAGTDIPFPAAVPAGQYLYAALHVLSVAGTSAPTLTALVESDTTAAFSAPATRLTFTPAAGVGGQLLRIAGPFTDTHYRVRWTVSGASPSFLFAATLGVAPA